MQINCMRNKPVIMMTSEKSSCGRIPACVHQIPHNDNIKRTMQPALSHQHACSTAKAPSYQQGTPEQKADLCQLQLQHPAIRT